jgi:hypothetical protein
MVNQTPPPANLWALSATAILTLTTRRVPRHDCLGGAPPGPEEEKIAKTILANSWGVESREKLESMIEWLSTRGHSADYQQAAAAFQQAPPAQRQGDPKLAFVGQYGAQLANRGLLAWDLGRLLALAGWGFLAGYCQEFEAWGVILPAADRIRGAYTSWEEYGQHYKLGALFAMPAAAGQIDQVLAQLASAPDSPWKTTPWQLSGAPNVGAPPYGVGAAGGVAPVAPVVPGGAPPGAMPGASPGASPGAPPGASPYGAPPGAPPGAGPYGGAPMVPAGGPPYGGGPMAGPRPGGGKSKTGLIIGAAVGGLIVVMGGVALIWHFTHEHEHEHEHPAAPAGKPHAHH